jgi:hypothetical protein
MTFDGRSIGFDRVRQGSIDVRWASLLFDGRPQALMPGFTMKHTHKCEISSIEVTFWQKRVFFRKKKRFFRFFDEMWEKTMKNSPQSK